VVGVGPVFPIYGLVVVLDRLDEVCLRPVLYCGGGLLGSWDLARVAYLPGIGLPGEERIVVELEALTLGGYLVDDLPARLLPGAMSPSVNCRYSEWMVWEAE
jgi:hypothetical protein